MIAENTLTKSISFQLLKKVFAIYFSMTIIITAIQIFIEYQETKSIIQKDLAALETTFAAPLKEAIWDIDNTQINSIATSIYNLSFVKELLITDINGNIIINNKKNEAKNTFSHQFNIFKEYDGKKTLLAKVTISSDQDAVMDVVKTGVYLLVISAVVKSLLLWLLFLWAFKRYLAKPLESITSQIEMMDFENIGKQKLFVKTKKDNELDILQISFNAMMAKLEDQKNIISKTEQEYVGRLEQVVKERTAELEKTIVELQHKENMLIIQSRFTAMGEMIANIAHQWRQPLNIIKGSISLLAFQKRNGNLKDELFASETTNVIRQIDYLSQTIDDLRNFYRDNEDDDFTLSNAIQKSLDLVSSSLKNNNIEYDFRGDYDTVLAGSEGKLIQVFVNILNNAKDAILLSKTTGAIIIETLLDKGFVVVEIIDSGGGINDSVIDSVFEPYFTTKHKSQGTGLGLYMSKQIVEKNFQGKMSVSNKKFSYNEKKYFGACFKIEIKGT